MASDYQWLGALLASESNEPHEWLYVGWVVRNRVEAEFLGDSTYVRVIRRRKQFSYWNQFEFLDDDDAYREACSGRIRHQLDESERYAKWILSTPREYAPFAPNVFYFWSPVSMPEDGRIPGWAESMDRFCPPDVDPWRFIFASDGTG